MSDSFPSQRGNNAPSTVMVVFGTRPEAIKMVPVVQALAKRPEFNTIVVNTGQHRDMVQPVLDVAGIEVDYDLECGGHGLTLAQITTRIIGALDGVLTELRGGPERRNQPRLFAAIGKENVGQYPALMLVHGDTTTAFAAATTGMSNRLPVVHVEAGLRSGNLHQPYPEEFNRQLIGRIAALNIAPTVLAKQSLVREGVDIRTIYVSGNTGVDAILWAVAQNIPYSNPDLAVVDVHRGPVVVATAHRRENWGAGIIGICRGLKAIAKARPDALIVVPMHLNPTVRTTIREQLGELDNVLLTEPLEYLDFARLLKRADIAISDSGGVQEEAPSLGTPVLVTRAVSERPEGVDAGMLALVGTDPLAISDLALKLLSDRVTYEQMVSANNPFGDGHAAERIAGALANLVYGMPVPDPFGPGFDRVTTLRNAGFDLAEVKASIGFIDQVTNGVFDNRRASH